MPGDGSDDAALGGAVKFGDDEAGNIDGLVEGLDLCQRVLAEVGVEYQQRFVRAARFSLLDNTTDLGNFFHQVQLGWQPAGGVGEHDIDAARPGG